jgi:hypothetical protein
VPIAVIDEASAIEKSEILFELGESNRINNKNNLAVKKYF